jgi:hypothetical protein
MPSVVRAFRASTQEFDQWRSAAERMGMSFNAWARRALNEQSKLEDAIRREEERYGKADSGDS